MTSESRAAASASDRHSARIQDGTARHYFLQSWLALSLFFVGFFWSGTLGPSSLLLSRIHLLCQGFHLGQQGGEPATGQQPHTRFDTLNGPPEPTMRPDQLGPRQSPSGMFYFFIKTSQAP